MSSSRPSSTRHFTPKSAARYDALASSAGEWNVTVIAPHFAGAFVARDLGDTDGPDMERRFDFCLTYDRDLAIEAARGLLARIAPR